MGGTSRRVVVVVSKKLVLSAVVVVVGVVVVVAVVVIVMVIIVIIVNVKGARDAAIHRQVCLRDARRRDAAARRKIRRRLGYKRKLAARRSTADARRDARHIRQRQDATRDALGSTRVTQSSNWGCPGPEIFELSGRPRYSVPDKFS